MPIREFALTTLVAVTGSSVSAAVTAYREVAEVWPPHESVLTAVAMILGAS